jgi:hypothetical protein
VKRNRTRKPLLLALAGLGVLAVSGFFAYKHLHPPVANFDVPFQKALAQVSSTHTYSQEVETSLTISDRTLRIVGVYEVDTDHKSYAGYSTTTLFIQGDPLGHSFTHQNISIDHVVYTKIDTSDSALRASIQRIPSWTSFKSTAIPERYSGVVINGPIQDNLTLLSNGGTYLLPQRSLGAQPWGDESLLRYTLSLSDRAFNLPDGPLNALVGRVGRTGVVDVWIDPTTSQVRHMVFQNPPYFSTTTILHINSLPLIEAPTAPKS